jgi:hypothetical protein
MLLVYWLISVMALDWDVQWHVNVGRDGFWTPPHWTFYTSIAASGLVCLVVTLLETYLYRRRYPGINDETTTPTLFIFRGPIGFMLAGFGMAVMLASAPLDDYWHRIYGIDVEIWTPFHIMLLLGVILANLGIIYIFASEVNRRKVWQKPLSPTASPANRALNYVKGFFRPATLGLIIAVALFLTRFWLLMAETFIGKAGPGTFTLGQFRMPSYSLAVALVPILLVALVHFTGRIGIATMLGVFFLLFRFADDAFVNWGVQTLALDQGLTLRTGAKDVVITTTVYNIFLPLAGLIVDGIYLFTRRWRSVSTSAPILTAVGAGLASGFVLYLLEKPWEAYNSTVDNYAAGQGVNLNFLLFKPDYWAALPFVLVIAVLAGLLGMAFGTSLRYTDK